MRVVSAVAYVAGSVYAAFDVAFAACVAFASEAC